jgi:hypothetical protein
MKQSGKLAVLGDFSLKDSTVIIHPNDGYDIGLMTTSSPIYLYTNVTLEEFQAGGGDKTNGSILLKNECRMGTVEINLKRWQQMGKPKHVILYYEAPHLLLALPQEA